MLGLGFGLGPGSVAVVAGGVPAPASFTATLTPAITPLFEGQTLSDVPDFDVMTGTGNFTSSAGPIASAIVTVTINGQTGAGIDQSTVLNEGDMVSFAVAVSDVEGNGPAVFFAVEVTVQSSPVTASATLPTGTTVDVAENGDVTVVVPSGTYAGTHTTTLSALPVFVVDPVIEQASATEGDDLTVTDGLLIYDGNAGTPTIVTSWLVDTVLENTTGLNMPAGSVVARQRATIGSDTVTADSAAITVASGRTIADVATDNPTADYFDFGDVTNLWEDTAKTTQISDDTTLIDYIDGETGVLNLQRQTSRHRPTFDSINGGIDWTSNGDFQWLLTDPVTVGPAVTVVTHIRADDVTTAAQIVHWWTVNNDKIFLHGYAGGGAARLAVRNAANTQVIADAAAATVQSGVDHVLTTVLGSDGSLTVRVDGVVVQTDTVATPLKALPGIQIRFGGSNSQLGGWDGLMRRAFVLPNGELSASDLEIVEAWVGST